MLPQVNRMEHEPLYHWIVVRPEPTGQFTAQLLGLPELRASAANRDEAIERLRVHIREWQAAGQLVPVESPGDNPLQKWFGWAKDDPEYGLFLDEIRRFREEVDQRELSE